MSIIRGSASSHPSTSMTMRSVRRSLTRFWSGGVTSGLPAGRCRPTPARRARAAPLLASRAPHRASPRTSAGNDQRPLPCDREAIGRDQGDIMNVVDEILHIVLDVLSGVRNLSQAEASQLHEKLTPGITATPLTAEQQAQLQALQAQQAAAAAQLAAAQGAPNGR